MATTKASKAKNQSQKAAELERDGQWGRASSAWRMAKSLYARSTTSLTNIKWCNNRAEHCEAMAITEDDDY